MLAAGASVLAPRKFSSHAAPAVISVRRTVALRFPRSGYSFRDHHTESSDISSNPGPILCGYNVKGPRHTLTYTACGDYTSTMTQRSRTYQIAALPLKPRSACRSDEARQPLTSHPQRALCLAPCSSYESDVNVTRSDSISKSTNNKQAC